MTWHQTRQRKLQLELPLRVLSCWLRRMSNVCMTCSLQASGEEDCSLSSFWSSCLMAAAAFLGQSYSSRSLICCQPDKRPSPLHLPDLLPECELRGRLLGFAELLGKCCSGVVGGKQEPLTPVLTSRKVMLSKPWGVLLSAGVPLASPCCFSQYQLPLATSARTMTARRRLSTTSVTKLPEPFSAGRGDAARPRRAGSRHSTSTSSSTRLTFPRSQPESSPHLPPASPVRNGSSLQCCK